MIRTLLLALGSASLAACATTDSMTAGGGGMAMAAFDHARSGGARVVTGYGYELSSHDGWSGRMAYEQEGNEARVSMRLRMDGGEADIVTLAIAMPYLDGGVRRFYGETEEGMRVAVELQAGPCEAAPGNGHTYFAAVVVGSRTLTGCGREVAQDDRWSNYLMDYLPAIDTCLAEFRNQSAHVSAAYTMRGGHTGVRIVDEDMQTWECATREAGEAVNSLRPLDAADAIYGEGDPIFVRGTFPDFGEGCYVYESVRHADGTLIGAFGYDACNAATVSAREPGVG
ncbi:hypothetical protein [Maricaulis sp.]|uniref:hypothetical protein n=1 Tax=Maricaulis sp. TaxID=1486257 RepID=UPI0026209058|nr:hypothetical protein [Maricaulis sp.]